MPMFKVVINAGYGGFELSDTTCDLINDFRVKDGKEPVDCFHFNSTSHIRSPASEFRRDDMYLVKAVEELSQSGLKIVSVDMVFKDIYTITERDGWESVNVNISRAIQNMITSNLDTSSEGLEKLLDDIYVVTTTYNSYAKVN